MAMTTKMKDWKFLTGDMNWSDYGGTWYLKVDDIYWLLRFENKQEWGDGATGYYCQVLRVDIESILADSDGDTGMAELMLVGSLVEYGVYSPMGASESNYPDRARAQARRSADALISDVAQCAVKLSEPANAIGATVEDFGRGCPIPWR